MKHVLATVATLAAVAASAQSLGDLTGALGKLTKPSAPAAATGAASAISGTEASGGLRAALGKAAEATVGQLGRTGGFANDPKVRIGLPGPLGSVMGLLGKAGIGGDLTGRMNAAAEGAVGKALPLLKTAITGMSVQDAMGIVTGGPTSATDYFRTSTGAAVQAQMQMQPVVAKSLTGVKAFAALDQFTAKNPVPGVNFGSADLTKYVTRKASDGVFYYLGEQEKAIRANPLGTGSALIAKVFGGR